MDFLSPITRKNNYSVERLRVLYTDLIQHIDIPNENLGRRAIGEDDVIFYKKSMRFTFRRKLIPDNTNDTLDFESRDTPTENESMSLLAAFRMLAAIRSPDKEGDTVEVAAMRDDCIAAALSSAKRIESRVVGIIKDIGEIVVNTKRSKSDVRGDPVFEYFCEKSILSLLVDIAKEKRQKDYNIADSSVHGVVWSPLVKAQCFQTTSQLLSDDRNSTAVYYLLSHNYINELITCMLPFRQWTDSALGKILPAYVNLLKTITMQLTNDSNMFPFLTMKDSKTGAANFPLFSAALEVTMSAFAQSDSEIYDTCLDVVINLMKFQSAPLQNWIVAANVEQRKLADHLCQRLLDRFYRISDICTGPVVDFARSNAISGQLSALADHLDVIQDVFWSRVRGLDVRLCESLLQRVVSVLLKNILPPRHGEQFLDVGVVDMDVIPQREARAQTSSVILAYLFSNLTYTPFQRMLAVAVLHPLSTSLWSSGRAKEMADDEYVFMPALSDIVTGEGSNKACPNLFRHEIIKALKGDYGDWRFISSACLLQSILDLDAIEKESLAVLEILPEFDEDGYRSSPLEDALGHFLVREHLPSRIAVSALDCAGHLAIQMVYSAIKECNLVDGEITETFDFILAHSVVWNGLLEARSFFAGEAIKFKETTGVSDILLDLIEAAISSRYEVRHDKSGDGPTTFTSSLLKRGCIEKLEGSEMLVRKNRDYGTNDIETARFFVNMALHYGALYKVVDQKLRLSVKIDDEEASLDFIDEADFLTRIVGGLVEEPKTGTDVDLTGRMVFRFLLAVNPESNTSEKSGRRIAWPRNLASDLMLILDPTYIFIVKVIRGQVEENRSTMLCSISLRSVIAAAADEEWLHVAVRHEDVDLLIKNGNMALQFENPGASLIVKNYLDRSREVLRQELIVKASELLTR